MAETMLAARYMGPDQLRPELLERPVVRHGEALVRIDACGFCGSDLNIVAGTHPRARAPLTIGHELAGTVVELAKPDAHVAVGDRVTMFPLISCGRCYACTHGQSHVCRELKLFGFDRDGGMADFVRLPIASLMKLPETMSPAIGALIEPLAVAVHAVGRADLADVDVAVVLGAGPIGLLTALVASAKGIGRVVISDVSEARLELARSLGLEAIEAGAPLLGHVMAITDQNGAGLVFECAGHPSSATEMTALARPRGVLVGVGVFKRPVSVDLQGVNFKELELVGSRVYTRDDFDEAIALASSLPLDRIISHRFPLEDVENAFAQFRSGDACKVLVEPRSSDR
ncbi:alcohol dehydrogenase catalytic domain-containing protein [Sphingomonas sp. BK580]|uniref:zinc-dependent alcohol dehydrogenase n=1 Tax=Sphingomonas sp. BK580 TaxID=2586972 RepID=UPI0016071111|nr:alcohol dehydrogenase catalytic domain-containing protein [Sphingomonas sp. BK580]MBB3695244.1 2-desacetyl-2-hydroxyethyl bacteriochlorophyllide A dehydrogenase [Sphingomonas sp. BK580]